MRNYGFLPDLPDPRDFNFRASPTLTVDLPEEVDLRNVAALPVLQQGALGACTAHASASAHLFTQIKQGKKVLIGPSRLFIYYNARALLGAKYVRMDSGCTIRGAFKSLEKEGACPENLWKYRTAYFATRPPSSAYRAAQSHQSLVYKRVPQTEKQIMGCLAEGYPIVFGMALFDSFDHIGRDGIVKMPKEGETLTGHHAMLMYGYKQIDGKTYIITLNSWGPRWADKGYCYIPIEYLTDHGLSSDHWTLQLVE